MFWRESPLTDAEKELLFQLSDAHKQSAFRANASSQAFLTAMAGSGHYTQALIGALSTLGGNHAPLVQTYELLNCVYADAVAKKWMMDGLKVPGWGNSFERGHPDPLWAEVDKALRAVAPEVTARIEAVTTALHDAGKDLYPNPSAYTAATAIAVGMPACIAPFLFVHGRLTAWSILFLQNTT